MDIDHFVPVSSSIFTRSFTVVLGLICAFHAKVRSSLGDRRRLLSERYDGCVVPWCLYLRTIVCTDEHGTFWRNVLWSDETKIELFGHNNHCYVWRIKGEAYKPKNILL